LRIVHKEKTAKVRIDEKTEELREEKFLTYQVVEAHELGVTPSTHPGRKTVAVATHVQKYSLNVDKLKFRLFFKKGDAAQERSDALPPGIQSLGNELQVQLFEDIG